MDIGDGKGEGTEVKHNNKDDQNLRLITKPKKIRMIMNKTK